MPITGVPPVVAAIYNSAVEQNISNNTWTIIDFVNKVNDTHNAVTTGAAWKFTAPVSGFYLVRASILFVSTSAWGFGETAIGKLFVNGGEVAAIAYRGGLSEDVTIYVLVAGGTLVYLNVGDYIDYRVRQLTGSVLALAALTSYNRITIIKYAGA